MTFLRSCTIPDCTGNRTCCGRRRIRIDSVSHEVRQPHAKLSLSLSYLCTYNKVRSFHRYDRQNNERVLAGQPIPVPMFEPHGTVHNTRFPT